MTKIIQGISNLTYNDKLKYLNLHTLERRRLRVDLFKWVKDF